MNCSAWISPTPAFGIHDRLIGGGDGGVGIDSFSSSIVFSVDVNVDESELGSINRCCFSITSSEIRTSKFDQFNRPRRDAIFYEKSI